MSLNKFTTRPPTARIVRAVTSTQSFQIIAGKWLIGSSAALFIGGITFLHNDSASLHDAIDKHSQSLSTISQQITDLTLAERLHDVATDDSIKKLTDNDERRAVAIAQAETQLESIGRSSTRIEHNSEPVEPSRRFTPIPENPIQSLGNALSHAFNPPHHWRGRRP